MTLTRSCHSSTRENSVVKTQRKMHRIIMVKVTNQTASKMFDILGSNLVCWFVRAYVRACVCCVVCVCTIAGRTRLGYTM